MLPEIMVSTDTAALVAATRGLPGGTGVTERAERVIVLVSRALVLLDLPRPSPARNAPRRPRRSRPGGRIGAGGSGRSWPRRCLAGPPASQHYALDRRQQRRAEGQRAVHRSRSRRAGSSRRARP